MTEAIRGDIKRKDVRVIEGTRGGLEYRVTGQVPLDYYLARGNITQREFRAGDRIFRDFTASGQVGACTINLDPMRGGKKEFSEKQLEALERYRIAMNSVQGMIGKVFVLNVCCYGEWLRDINHAAYNPKQRMPRFREALGDLVEHYERTNKFFDRSNLA